MKFPVKRECNKFLSVQPAEINMFYFFQGIQKINKLLTLHQLEHVRVVCEVDIVQNVIRPICYI